MKMVSASALGQVSATKEEWRGVVAKDHEDDGAADMKVDA